MRTTVIDASAVLAFLFDEPGAEKLEVLLHQAAEADKPLLITAANWTEVLCHIRRKRGDEGVTSAKSFLRTMPVEIAALDSPLAETAAELQFQHGFGLARAFAVALSKSRKAELVTADAALKPVEKLIKISWLTS
jgi:predicted nucleic acid-binding protein